MAVKHWVTVRTVTQSIHWTAWWGANSFHHVFSETLCITACEIVMLRQDALHMDTLSSWCKIFKVSISLIALHSLLFALSSYWQKCGNIWKCPLRLTQRPKGASLLEKKKKSLSAVTCFVTVLLRQKLPLTWTTDPSPLLHWRSSELLAVGETDIIQSTKIQTESNKLCRIQIIRRSMRVVSSDVWWWRKKELNRWRERRWARSQTYEKSDRKWEVAHNWSNSHSGHSAEAEQLFFRWC